MLPLWRERVNVFLHPEHVVMMRVSGTLGKKLLHKQIYKCSTQGREKGLAWERPIMILDKALQKTEWSHAPLNIVLSNQWVHYAIVPDITHFSSVPEKEAYLRHRFVESYGDVAKHWDMRVSENGVGRASLASAVDAELISALMMIGKRYQVQIQKVNPHLMSALNLIRKQTLEPTQWLVIMEPNSICLLLIESNQFMLVRQHTVDTVDIEQLTIFLQREAIILAKGTTKHPLFLYWPEATVPYSLPGYRVNQFSPVLYGLSNRDNPLYRLALSV